MKIRVKNESNMAPVIGKAWNACKHDPDPRRHHTGSDVEKHGREPEVTEKSGGGPRPTHKEDYKDTAGHYAHPID